MDEWIKTFSRTIAGVVDAGLHAPLWALLGWVTAAVLTIAMISTFAASARDRGKVVLYIAAGLILYIEILRPVGWMLWTD